MKITYPIVTWEQYFNSLVREKTKKTIEEYNRLDSYGLDLDSNTYKRSYVKLVDLDEPAEAFRKQLLEQLEEAKVPINKFSRSLNDSVIEASKLALENFCSIERCVLVKLSEEEYVLAPLERGCIVIKLYSPLQGCVIAYRPISFTRFVLEDPK